MATAKNAFGFRPVTPSIGNLPGAGKQPDRAPVQKQGGARHVPPSASGWTRGRPAVRSFSVRVRISVPPRAAGISPASVQRLWAASDIKPHLSRTFKLSTDKRFAEKFWDVIGLYLNPPERALVLCQRRVNSDHLGRLCPAAGALHGGTALVLEAVALALNGDHCRMVQQPVEHRRGQHHVLGVDAWVSASDVAFVSRSRGSRRLSRPQSDGRIAAENRRPAADRPRQ